MPFVVSFIVNKHTNEIQSIDVLYVVNAKNKGNNDDTANAKALASTSETSVGNVSFNSSISKYSDNVKKFSLDVDYAEGVLLFVIKSVAENKFYIHNMNLQNKNKADKTLHALGFNTSQHERIISLAKDNIANNVSNVNNAVCCFVYSE